MFHRSGRWCDLFAAMGGSPLRQSHRAALRGGVGPASRRTFRFADLGNPVRRAESVRTRSTFRLLPTVQSVRRDAHN